MTRVNEIDPPRRAGRVTAAAAVRRRGEPGRQQGTGDQVVKVKGARATAQQRIVIDGVLAQCRQDGASRRVMIAAIMCITQESLAGKLINATPDGDNADDSGIYRQGREWISLSGSRQPGPATHAFLITGPRSWKKQHGSVRNGSGDLNTMIMAVQSSVGGYSPWEAEATKTVDAWIGTDGDIGAGSFTTVVTEPYLFERGTRKGAREDSWEASGRLAKQVGFRRWAALNTLHYVSDVELRAAAPSLVVDGDEGWLLARPTYEWGAIRRPVTEVTLSVLSERWGVLPGAVVVLSRKMGALQGRYLVASVTDDLWAPSSSIVLRRPVPSKPEPKNETRTSTTTADPTSSTATFTEGSEAARLLAACESVDRQNLPYAWGGGHPRAGTPSQSTKAGETQIGYDCSGAVAAALVAAGIGKLRRGQGVVGSGSFGQAYLTAGPGDGYSVMLNSTHAWVKFTGAGRVKRFDTSNIGGGPRGPHVRTTNRGDEGNFAQFH